MTEGSFHASPPAPGSWGSLRELPSLLGIILLAICLSSGCASTGGSGGTVDPNDPTANVPTGPSAGQRAQSAMEGLLMGAIIGGQAGPLGAAVGAASMMIYAAITGEVPFTGSSGSGPVGSGGQEAEREAEMERQIEDEMSRQSSLEAEIEEELRRQEELLNQIEGNTESAPAPPDVPTAVGASDSPDGTQVASVDPRVAPRAPSDRDLPAAIFDEERRTIKKGEWDNPKKMKVTVRSLDADRDGNPEQIRYHDEKTGAIVRKEVDRDYDGRIDGWTRYESGQVVEVIRDNDGDGAADEWQEFGRDGVMAGREVDRDGDGTRDAFYRFEQGSLVEERHDLDSSGSIDRVIHYEDRRLARAEEDRDRDGQIDTWTSYRVSGDREVVDRIEKDTTGDGKRDTFEVYEEIGGKTAIKTRDEDKNADGVIDVKSVYEDGKLKQREISDPAMVPL